MNCKTANNCFDGGSGAGNVAQSGGRGGKRVSVGNRASHTSMSMYLVHNLMDCIPTRHNHAANLHMSTQELNQLPWMDKQHKAHTIAMHNRPLHGLQAQGPAHAWPAHILALHFAAERLACVHPRRLSNRGHV